MTTMARPADLAGTWYPGSASACERFFQDAGPAADSALSEIGAAIVPHAGWLYSGRLAFRTLERLQCANPNADLVLVFGGHLDARSAPRLMIEGGFDTPFGATEPPLDLAQDLAMAVECELETPAEYYDDNAVEVLMPMIRYLWPKAKVLALGAPPTEKAVDLGREALALARRHGFRNIVAVGSTDLTHYGPNYRFEPQGRGARGLKWVKESNDPQLIGHIEKLDAAKVLWTAQRQHNACCPGAAAAAITVARGLGALRAECTGYTTSHDERAQQPEPSSFVGYVGAVLGR